MQNSKTFGTCATCHRHTALTKHHLIPKKTHKKNKKTPHEHNIDDVIMICRKCHDGIHDLYDERTLAEQFNTLKELSTDAALEKHFLWVSKCKKGIL